MIKNFFRQYYKVFLGMLFGMVVTTTSVCFAYCVWAKDVPFTSSTGLASTNVQDAIDELNKKQMQCPTEPEPEPEDPIPAGTICIRAKQLHSEICQTGGTCGNPNNEIVYGNLGTKGQNLQVGDALDCDVNGDGTYDAQTERFYYLTDLEGNNNYAVLIYYSNLYYGPPVGQLAPVKSGAPISYNSGQAQNGTSFSGPASAIQYLPTTSMWSNVSLSSTTRNIKYVPTYREPNNTLTFPFSYDGYAARIVSYYELNDCNASGWISQANAAALKSSCNFLVENTRYDGISGYSGYWTEDVFNMYNYPLAVVNTMQVVSKSDGYSSSGGCGTRPVIEVKKSDIYY